MTVSDIFNSLEYGTAPENGDEARAWIASHNGTFGHFIGGDWTAPKADFSSKNPATGDVLAQISQAAQADVDAAVATATMAQPAWAAAGGPARARILYALARLLQKHARLFATLETLDNGKSIRESRDIDIPLAQRHFCYHAGLAQIFESENPDQVAHGVCGQIIPWNFPLLMLSWKIAPALAAGNTVLLKPAEYTPLTALLFADICNQAGVPAGVVNIITGDGAVGEMIVQSNVQKIAFTGSTAVGKHIQTQIAGAQKSLTLELGGKSVYIVFDDADIPSAIECLVDAIWFNQGQVCCAGSRLIVQEGIADRFYAQLKTRMDKLRIGDPMDKSIDVGAMVDPVQKQNIENILSANEQGQVYCANTPVPNGSFYPPTLITGLHTADTLMQEEIFGPILVSTTFRTPEEAVEIANNTRYGLAATIWSENINLALGVAPKLAAGVVWINSTNLFDAAAPFGGVRESGFGREGGQEGLRAYTKPKTDMAKAAPCVNPQGATITTAPIDRTAKLYIGGKQCRPDGGYSAPVYNWEGSLIGNAPIANRKDIRNAIEAQLKAAKWSESAGHTRAQILYYIAENLSARAAEFAENLDAQTGKDNGAREVEESLNTLFTYAAWADKYDGMAKSPPLRGLALALREPIGPIAALCQHDAPLLGLITPLAAALSQGNTITLIASENAPLIAADLYQVLETSDVPAGTVNILTGRQAELAPHLGGHIGVQALWCLSDDKTTALAQSKAAQNVKRIWLGAAQNDTPEWLNAATEVKTIWVPYGE